MLETEFVQIAQYKHEMCTQKYIKNVNTFSDYDMSKLEFLVSVF